MDWRVWGSIPGQGHVFWLQVPSQVWVQEQGTVNEPLSHCYFFLSLLPSFLPHSLSKDKWEKISLGEEKKKAKVSSQMQKHLRKDLYIKTWFPFITYLNQSLPNKIVFYLKKKNKGRFCCVWNTMVVYHSKAQTTGFNFLLKRNNTFIFHCFIIKINISFVTTQLSVIIKRGIYTRYIYTVYN